MRRLRKPAPLHTIGNVIVPMAILFATVLMIIMIVSKPPGCGSGPDLARVSHPVAEFGADRDDAMIVTVLRHGVIYFGAERVNEPTELASKFHDSLGSGAERKVYIKADARAKWGRVRQTLAAVPAAGMMRVAFLVEQRKTN